MERVCIDGQEFLGLNASLGESAPLLILKTEKGYLACGYINMATSEKLGDAAAIVRGVKTYEDMLKAQVQEVSGAAQKRGVKAGMTGREALKLLV